MGGHAHIGEGQKPRHGGMLQNPIRHILVDRAGLLLVNIKTHRKKLAVPDPLDQILRPDQRAS